MIYLWFEFNVFLKLLFLVNEWILICMYIIISDIMKLSVFFLMKKKIFKKEEKKV